MARVSTKENKAIYQLTRESLKPTWEDASELLVTMLRRLKMSAPCPIRMRCC